jgi:hypothetical protein
LIPRPEEKLSPRSDEIESPIQRHGRDKRGDDDVEKWLDMTWNRARFRNAGGGDGTFESFGR